MRFISDIYKRTARIFYSGVTPDMPFSDVQKTVMFNMAMMIGLPFIIAGIPINFANGRYYLAWFNIILLAQYSIGIYINAIQKKLWIRKLIFFLTSGMFVIGPLYFRNGTEYVLLITLMTAVIMLDNKIEFLLFALAIIGFVTYIRVRDINLLGFETYAEANPYVNVFYSQFLYVIFLYSFKYLYDKYQNQLTLSYEKLKQSKETKERILRVVAHDLRSPVGGIFSLSSIMLDGQESLTENQQQYLKMIHNTSTQSLALINQLLQNETDDQMVLVAEQTDINQLVNDTASLLQYKAEEKQQSIILQLFSTPVSILCDHGKITRVLQNLISNAIKFTGNNGHITLSVFMDVDFISISIEDDGIGIPDEMRTHLFDMFTTAKRTGTAGEKSFGIGLSVCKQIIDAHQGNILVASEKNKGTVFTVQLPINK